MAKTTIAALLFVIGAVCTNYAEAAVKIGVPQNATASVIESPKNSSSILTNVTETDNIDDETWEFENTTIIDTRRILFGKEVPKGKRQYMVYLQLTQKSAKAHKYRGWLCGGVIVHAHYVLTSAACVEDADHFYVVSGTNKFVDSFDYKTDDCVCNHRRKVVWKCIPKNYKFDFQDSTKWSSNDIAVVRVDHPFKLGVVEKGCQFAADIVCYNNISKELEKPGTKGYIVGWGTGSSFREGVYRAGGYMAENAKCLQEAKVCIMDNEACSKKWAQKFRSIIQQYMICTKDVMRRLSEICDKKYANCTDIEDRRRHDDTADNVELSSLSVNVDVGRHLLNPDHNTARRSSLQGGFCENDHGGPLIIKYQGKERVIGVISACKIDPKSHSCHGPFLYTSVFKNRQFLSCAINKDVEESCRRVFRTGITHDEWDVDWDGVDEEEEKLANEALVQDKKSESDNDSDDSSDGDVKEEPKAAEVKADSDESEEEQTEKPKKTTKKSHKGKKSKHADGSSDKTKKSKKKKQPVKEKEEDKTYESSKDVNVNEPDSS